MIKKLLTLLRGNEDVFAFTYQDEGTCGAHVVMNAAACLGIPLSSDQVLRASGLSRKRSVLYGSSEDSIKRALSKFNLEATFFCFNDEASLKKQLDRSIENGFPVIISCQEENHWAVIAAKDAHHNYIWIDSNDESILGVSELRAISEWMVYYDEEDKEQYFMIQVKPKDQKLMRHSITGCMGKLVKLQQENPDLVEYWCLYLYYLLDVFNSSDKDQMTASEFFSKYRKVLLESASKMESDSDLNWELQNLETVSVTHNLSFNRSNELLALLQINTILANISQENY